MNLKSSLEKNNKANDSDSYDYMVKNMKDKRQDKYYLPKTLKKNSNHEDKLNEKQAMEKIEIEKMRVINEQVKIVKFK